MTSFNVRTERIANTVRGGEHKEKEHPRYSGSIKTHSYFIELFNYRKLEALLFIYSDFTSYCGKNSISK
jgi:hypothetical protein